MPAGWRREVGNGLLVQVDAAEAGGERQAGDGEGGAGGYEITEARTDTHPDGVVVVVVIVVATERTMLPTGNGADPAKAGAKRVRAGVESGDMPGP